MFLFYSSVLPNVMLCVKNLFVLCYIGAMFTSYLRTISVDLLLSDKQLFLFSLREFMANNAKYSELIID